MRKAPFCKERAIYLCVIAVLVALVIVLLVCLKPGFDLNGINASAVDAKRFKQSYEALNDTTRAEDGAFLAAITVPEDNPFSYVTPDEAWAFAKEGTGVIFIGAPWCRLCRLSVEAICRAAQKYDQCKTIRYIPWEYNKPDQPTNKNLAEALCTYLADYDAVWTNVTGSESTIESRAATIAENGARLFPGILMFYDAGTLVGINVGTVSGHSSSDIPLTEDEIQVFIAAFDLHAKRFGTHPCPSELC